MKRIITFIMVAVSLSIIVAAQTAPAPAPQAPNPAARKVVSPLAQYSGAWIAAFDNHPWLAIELKLQGNQLLGTLNRPHDFQFDNQGGIKSVSQQRVVEGIENAVLQGDGLLFTVKDPATQKTDSYVMRLINANTAEVKMSGMAMQPGMPKPLPWKLSRVTPNANAAATAAPVPNAGAVTPAR